jgi:alpha,alpha-trehalose-phosphate synthase [UDP-forming]
MRRYYLLWLLTVTLISLAAAGIQSTRERVRLSEEVDSRASTLLSVIDDSALTAYHAKRFSPIAKAVNRMRNQESDNPIVGLAICGAKFRKGFPNGAGWESVCGSPHLNASYTHGRELKWDVSSGKRHFRYTVRPLPGRKPMSGTGALVLVQDVSRLNLRWLQSFVRSFFFCLLSGLILTGLIVTQVRSWVQNHLRVFRHALRLLIAGKKPSFMALPSSINQDIDKLATKIQLLSDSTHENKSEPSWTQALRKSMNGCELLVVSNREPYIHQHKDGKIQVMRPASGLVTALEPVLRQCGGMWIAHGSGSADMETVDAQGMIDVPPGQPRYKLKRVWLSEAEEEGYYYGFSNEGLWPLCHLAHTRPTFRLSDWEHYQRVNQKFCNAIPADRFNSRSVFLIQDYHFALLPQMIKKQANSPKIGLFWHIPWPNPEAFGICPWNQELLRGLLGADVVGFHTQYHCNNFLETCNRYLEARIDYERFSVTMENHETIVRAFPIGIDTAPVRVLNPEEIAKLKLRYGITAEKVAVGVDRLDYTKGLVERIEAVERFLELYPEWIGRFTLAQMGSPSRTHIPAYQELSRKLEEAVTRVNKRFGQGSYMPVVLLPSHHDWEEIQYFYQMGDVCMVTSLHDGMNLVAKEYVWCQAASRGSLILSKFAGASRELSEAFIVNPYSIEEMAEAIGASLRLSPAERELRMRSMKEKVQARSAFHWATDLIEATIASEIVPAVPEDLGRIGNLRSIKVS